MGMRHNEEVVKATQVMIQVKTLMQVYQEIGKFIRQVRSEEVPRIVQMIEYESLKQSIEKL